MKIDAFWRVLDDGFLFVVNQLLHLVMYAGFYNAFEPIYNRLVYRSLLLICRRKKRLPLDGHNWKNFPVIYRNHLFNDMIITSYRFILPFCWCVIITFLTHWAILKYILPAFKDTLSIINFREIKILKIDRPNQTKTNFERS